MNKGATRSDIAHIEEHIEALQESIARCRKLSLVAKISIATGAAWITLTLFGLVDFVPFMLVAAMAAVIGGIVLAGSNSTTWTQTEATLAASEAMRTEMIGRMEMRVVGEDSRMVIGRHHHQ
jgi:hypothetical protein